ITLSGSDVDGDALTFAIGTGPTHGTLGTIGTPSCPAGVPRTCTATVTYTPNANYNHAAAFTSPVNDGTATSTAATVSITVTAVNDPPTASTHSLSLRDALPIFITLSGSDVDGDALTFAIGTGPTHGTLGTIGTPSCPAGVPRTCTATVTYTPN